MHVILLEKISALGKIGDTVKVKNGYARNFLFPNKKALFHTQENIKYFEKIRAELEAKDLKTNQDAQALADQLNGTTIAIESLANAEGKLFGSIGTQVISQALKDKEFPIERQQVLMPLGPIRETGTSEISLKLHQEITATITVSVVVASN